MVVVVFCFVFMSSIKKLHLLLLSFCFVFSPTLAGVYNCVAIQYIQNRKVGEILSEVILVETLPEAPIITQDLDPHISLCEGSPILLKIKATGYPPPTFEWLHGNEVLTTETNNYFYVKTKKMSLLKSFCYICVVLACKINKIR